ncbi:MAG: hypothetical protein ACOX44_08865 [Limnochordia bacterium]|jgi:hypothetical protein
MIAAYKAIAKHKLRTAKGLLKHYWPSYLGILLGVVFLGSRLIAAIGQIGLGRPPTPAYIPYLPALLIVMNGYRLWGQTPVIRINAATLHYLYHTGHFQRILLLKYLWSLVKNLLAALVSAGLISGFRQPEFVTYTVLLTLYLYAGVISAWLSYHGKGRQRRITLVVYLVMSAGLLMPNAVLRFAGVGGGTLAALYMLYRLPHLNLARYYQDLFRLDQNMAYVSRYDLAQMLQTTAEYAANRRRRLLLHHLPLNRSNALFLKSCITTVRTDPRIWTILISLLLFSTLLYRTSLFAGIPVLGDPASATPISVLLIMTVYANMGELLQRQMQTMLNKQRLGLFLPMEQRQIVFAYIAWGSLLNLGLTISVGCLMASNAIYLMAFYILYSAIYAFNMHCVVGANRAMRSLQKVIRILQVLIGFLIVA